MDLQKLSERLHQSRMARNMTMSRLSELTGVNKSTVHRYENGGITSPREPVLRSIARVLGVEYEWLVGEKDGPSASAPDERECLSLMAQRPELRKLLEAAQVLTPVQILALVQLIQQWLD